MPLLSLFKRLILKFIDKVIITQEQIPSDNKSVINLNNLVVERAKIHLQLHFTLKGANLHVLPLIEKLESNRTDMQCLPRCIIPKVRKQKPDNK